jgi:hypothetical protein
MRCRKIGDDDKITDHELGFSSAAKAQDPNQVLLTPHADAIDAPV